MPRLNVPLVILGVHCVCRSRIWWLMEHCSQPLFSRPWQHLPPPYEFYRRAMEKASSRIGYYLHQPSCLLWSPPRHYVHAQKGNPRQMGSFNLKGFVASGCIVCGSSTLVKHWLLCCCLWMMLTIMAKLESIWRHRFSSTTWSCHEAELVCQGRRRSVAFPGFWILWL